MRDHAQIHGVDPLIPKNLTLLSICTNSASKWHSNTVTQWHWKAATGSHVKTATTIAGAGTTVRASSSMASGTARLSSYSINRASRGGLADGAPYSALDLEQLDDLVNAEVATEA